LEISKLQALVLSLAASAVSLLWCLFWIGHDIVVLNIPPSQVNLVYYVGAILSLGMFVGIAGYGLGARDQEVENLGVRLQLESLIQLERKEDTEIEMVRGLQTLKSELIELRRRYEETIVSLQTL